MFRFCQESLEMNISKIICSVYKIWTEKRAGYQKMRLCLSSHPSPLSLRGSITFRAELIKMVWFYTHFKVGPNSLSKTSYSSLWKSSPPWAACSSSPLFPSGCVRTEHRQGAAGSSGEKVGRVLAKPTLYLHAADRTPFPCLPLPTHSP